MPVQLFMIVGLVLTSVFVLDNLKHNRHPIDANSQSSEKILVVNRSCVDGIAEEADNTLTVGSVSGASLGR